MKAKLPTREQSGMPGSRQPNAGGWDSGVGCRWQADDGANIKESRWQKPTVKEEKIRLSNCGKWEGMGGWVGGVPGRMHCYDERCCRQNRCTNPPTGWPTDVP